MNVGINVIPSPVWGDGIYFSSHIFYKRVTKTITSPFKNLYPFFEIIGNGITWIVNGIKTLWDILMMIKKNNCPAIDWK